VQADSEEAELTGAITSLTPLVVGGVTVHTDATTQVRQGDHMLTLADLTVGETVHVEGAVASDGSITATEIEVVTAEDEENEAEVEGVIQSIDATHSTFVVAVEGDDEMAATMHTVTIATDAHTMIRSGDEAIAFGALATGNRVHVRGTRQSDGSVLASVIRVAPGFHARAELSGTVGAINADKMSLTVAGIVVNTDANTRITMGDDGAATFADIHVGDIVHVSGTPPGDGSILASSIRIGEL
jgi:hypothetical protein